MRLQKIRTDLHFLRLKSKLFHNMIPACATNDLRALTEMGYT